MRTRQFARHQPVRLAALVAVGLAALLASPAPIADETPPVASAGVHRVGAPGVRVHQNGIELRRATHDAGAALLREDRAAFVEATARMKRVTRPLPSEAADELGEAIRGFDVAFHNALDRVREHAAEDDMSGAFDAFFWVQRTCRSCHAQARERGYLPESGPLWRPDGTPFQP